MHQQEVADPKKRLLNQKTATCFYSS
jgi:hypothetical protein